MTQRLFCCSSKKLCFIFLFLQIEFKVLKISEIFLIRNDGLLYQMINYYQIMIIYSSEDALICQYSMNCQSLLYLKYHFEKQTYDICKIQYAN